MYSDCLYLYIILYFWSISYCSIVPLETYQSLIECCMIVLMSLLFLQDSPFFQNYELNLKEGILGDGSFSVCRKCINRQTGQEFAVKIVSRKIDCTNEINLLRACQGHPNIVKLHEVYHDEVSLSNMEVALSVQ